MVEFYNLCISQEDILFAFFCLKHYRVLLNVLFPLDMKHIWLAHSDKALPGRPRIKPNHVVIEQMALIFLGFNANSFSSVVALFSFGGVLSALN